MVGMLLGTALGSIAVPAFAAEHVPAPTVVATVEPATADDDIQTRKDEIVVNGERIRKTGSTGTKTETPLIRTPQVITSIDEKELTLRNALSINQALGYVAGVSPNQRGNVATRYDQLYVRGFAPGQYMDGMRLLGGVYSTPQIDFHLVERVDVIKGPASVLYGNSTPGGLVNLTSKVPYAESGGRIELAGGNFDLLRSAIDVNQPLDRDHKWLFRVIAGAERSDGFVAMTGNRRYYARPMLTFAPDEATSVTLILNYQRDPESASYSGVPVYGSALANPLGQFATDFNVSEPAYEAFDRKQKSATLLFRHDFNDRLSWATSARYLDVDLHYRQIYLSAFATTGTGANRNTDFSTIVRGGGGSDESFRTITIDNHATAKFATGPLQHTLLAGVDWQNNQGNNDQQFNTGVTTNPATSIPNLDPVRARLWRRAAELPAHPDAQLPQDRPGRRLCAGPDRDRRAATDRERPLRLVRPDDGERNAAAGAASGVTRLHQTAFTGAPRRAVRDQVRPRAVRQLFGKLRAADRHRLRRRIVRAGHRAPVRGRAEVSATRHQRAVHALRVRPAPPERADDRSGTTRTSQIQIGEVAVRGIELDGRGEITPGLTVTVAGTYTVPERHAAARRRRHRRPAERRHRHQARSAYPSGARRASSTTICHVPAAARCPACQLRRRRALCRQVRRHRELAWRRTQTLTTRFQSPGYVLVDAVLGYDFGKFD